MSTIGIDIRLIGKKQTGSEAVFFNLVKNFAQINSENEYRLFTDRNDGNELEMMKNDLGIANKKNFEIISLPASNKFSWNFWILPGYLRKNPVDIYLTQYITPFFVPKKIKIATIIHDISFKVYKQYIKKTDLFFLSHLIPWSLKRADKIIVVSQFTENEIIKYYDIPREKIDYIHNAVSDDFLSQDLSEEKIASIKKKYNLPEKYILYIGTLQPRKNIPSLIEAFALLRMKQPEIKLVLAGGKGHNYDRQIDKTIKKGKLVDSVLFPGFIDEEDKAAVMKGAEAFCYPSFYEGFGIPILEAMSVGVPVVVSKIPAHEEIAGSAAAFFNPNVSGELFQKFSEIMNNPMVRESLITQGKEQAKKYSWAKTAQKMVEIFKSL